MHWPLGLLTVKLWYRYICLNQENNEKNSTLKYICNKPLCFEFHQQEKFQRWWLESNWRSIRTQRKRSTGCVNSPWSRTGTRESSFWHHQTIHRRSYRQSHQHIIHCPCTPYISIQINNTNLKQIFFSYTCTNKLSKLL